MIIEQKHGSRTKASATLVSVAMLMLSYSSAHAQATLDEITVTATKRVESIQDVPVAVTAINEERMLNLGINDMNDLASFVPNFEVAQATMISNLYIRGIGGGLSHSTEQSAGLFVDGVYIGRSTAINMGFLDVGMVEVLRGPQGTLFGKNTVAGALIVRTNDPTEEFEGDISASVGNYSTVGSHSELQARISGPISDNVGFRLAAKASQSDGFVENLSAGPDGAERNDVAVRAKLRWTPSDATTVDLRLDHAEYDTKGQVASEIFSAPPPVQGAYQAFDSEFSNELDWVSNYDCSVGFNGLFCPNRDQKLGTYAVTINHDFDSGTLTSISAFQDYDYQDDFYAADTGLVGSFTATRKEDFDSFSQEIRFASDPDKSVDYIVGAYYESNEIDRDQSTSIHFPSLGAVLGPAIPPLPPLARNENWDQETTSVALFGQLRWNVSDLVNLTFGLRTSSEDKDFEFERVYTQYMSDVVFDTSVFPPPAQAALFGKLGPLISRDASRSSRGEDKTTGSFTLRYEPNDDVMVYYTLSQGHKTGGFDDRVISLDDIGFDEETSLMHEVGLKSVLANGRLSLNLAAFDISFDDMQVTSFLASSFAFLTSNAAEATSRGVELEWQFAASENWLFGGFLGYLDAFYDDFDTAPCTMPQEMGAPGCVAGVQDLSGQTLQFAPELEGNVFAEFSTANDSGWVFATRVEVNYSGEFYTDLDLDSTLLQDSYSKVNASVRLLSPNDKFEIALIGRNLSDKKTMGFGVDTPLVPSYFGALDPPRDLSIRFAYRF